MVLGIGKNYFQNPLQRYDFCRYRQEKGQKFFLLSTEDGLPNYLHLQRGGLFSYRQKSKRQPEIIPAA